MDVERTIDDIQQLQEMFEAPDIRPLSSSDISAANRRHDEMLAQTSVITSKAANSYHFKTGQRDWPSGTENVLPCRLLWWQVGFGAPASGAAFEHVSVVQ
jgi:hypothetical protein